MPNHAMSGTITIGSNSYWMYSKFAERSIVYRIDQAEKGIIEKIAIKKINSVGIYRIPMYVDSYNAIYEENELCTRSEAMDLYENYLQTS